MNSYGAASQEEMMASLLQNLENSDDPYKKMLGQMMLQNWQPNKATPSSITNHENIKKTKHNENATQDVRTLITMNRELLHDLKKLRVDFQQLQETNAFAADALGACACWGQDAVCPKCHGQGIPGSFEINEPKFSHLIQPLFERIINALMTNTAESK